MSLLVTGSIGIDTVEAPAGKVEDVLGGSSIYFAYAASFFGAVRLVGVVGDDVPDGFLAPVEVNPQIDTSGIEVRAAFMFGNPGETVESMRRTIDFAKALDPDIAVFNITTPYPGTQLFDWAKKHGYLRTLDWNEYDLANSVMELPTVSAADINRMYKVAYREFFFRPGYLVRRFLRMRSLEDVRMNIRALRSVLFVRTTAPCPRKYERTEGRSVGRLEPVPTQSPVEVCT